MLMMKKMFVFFVMMVMCGGAQKIVCVENEREKDISIFKNLSFGQELFHEEKYSYPVKSLFIKNIAGDDETMQCKIGKQAQTVCPLIHEKVRGFLDKFIVYKQEHGNALEKGIYKDMSLAKLIVRLLSNRPATLYKAEGEYYVAEKNFDKTYSVGRGNFYERNEKEWEMRYLSQDEANVASLIGIVSGNSWINTGDRCNRAKPGDKDTYIKEGVCAGLVGACFEQGWQIHNVLLRDTTTFASKVKFNDEYIRDIWLELFDMQPGDIAENSSNNQFKNEALYPKVKNKNDNNTESLFDTKLYIKLMKFVVQPFLLDADKRAEECGKKAYVHAVGLGLGVWALNEYMQSQCLVEVFEEIISEENLSHISDINFSWFPEDKYVIAGEAIDYYNKFGNKTKHLQKNSNDIVIHFSRRNPADLLPPEDSSKLLVGMYAWDSNALPGNEGWKGYLSASGDPAALCCGTIGVMQVRDVNPFFETNIIKIYGTEEEKKESAANDLNQKIEEQRIAAEKLAAQKNIEIQNNRWNITKFFAGFKICKGTVIPVGIAALCAVLYYCFAHGIGTGMI